MQRVTDPNILKELNSSNNQSQAQQKLKRVTDPNILKELNKPTPRLKRVTDPEILKSLNTDSSTEKSFLQGFTHNFDEYAASFNAGMNKLHKSIFGKEGEFFKANQDYWNRQKHLNELETYKHPWARTAGEVILDPINLAPGGVFTKGAKAGRIVKSMAGGAGVGYGTMAFKNYGDQSKTDEQKQEERAFGGGVGAVINGVIATITKGRVKNLVKEDIDHSKVDTVLDDLATRPEAFGLSKAEGDAIAQEVQNRFKVEPQYKTERPFEYEPEQIVEHQGNQGNVLPYKNDLWQRMADAKKHQRYKELIDMRRDVAAKDTYAPQKLVSPRDIRGVNYGKGWENEVTPAIYEKNYDHDFMLTKADIKKLESGRIDDELLSKIETDLGMLDNSPEWSKKPENNFINEKPDDMDWDDWAEFNTIFSNGGSSIGHSLAGGVGVGTLNASNAILDPKSADENGDGLLTGDELEDKFIHGFLAGTLGVGAIKVLRHTNPKAYEKVRSYILQNFNPDGTAKGGVRIGMFVGSHPKEMGSFSDVTTGATMREIDDSGAKIENIHRGSHALSDILKHEELFEKYPQLKDTKVTLKEMKEGSNGYFDRNTNEIVLNANMSKDEIKSSLLHELQHAIQNKEGWATGGSAQQFYNDFKNKLNLLRYELEFEPDDFIRDKKLKELEEIEQLAKSGKDKELAFDKYQRLWGEQQARATQYRKDMTPQERMSEDWTQTLAREEGEYKEPIVQYDNSGIALHAKELEEKYLNKRSDRVLENELLKEAKQLPRPKSFDEFAKDFGTYGWTKVETPVGNVKLNVKQTYEHFMDNTHYQDRMWLTGAFKSLLEDPLFVVKNPMKKQIEFYKPFKDKNGAVHYIGIAKGDDGKLKYITSFDRGIGQIKNMIKSTDGNLMYFKYSRNAGNSVAESGKTSATKGWDNGNTPETIPQNNGSVKLGMFAGDAPKGAPEKPKEYAAHLKRIAYERINKEWSDISHGIKGEFKRLFTNTLSGKYLYRRDAVNAVKTKLENDAIYLHESLKQLPQADRELLHKYIVGDVPPSQVPENIRAVGENMRKSVSELTDQIVEAGIMSREAVDEWGKYYLKRLYKKHYTKENGIRGIFGGKTLEKLHERGAVKELGNKDVAGLNELLEPLGVDASGYKSIDEFMAQNEELLKRPMREGGVRITKLPNGKYKVKRDYTFKERSEMEEIRDAAITVPETIMKLGILAEHAKFLRDVEHIDGAVVNEELAKGLSHAELANAGYTKLPNNAKYGVLAGKWVRKDVADDIDAMNKHFIDAMLGENGSVLAEKYNDYLTLWKKSKTVWNAPAHVNNFLSNLFLMQLAGVGYKGIGETFADAIKALFGIENTLKNLSTYKMLAKKSMIGRASQEELQHLAKMQKELKYVLEAENLGMLNQSRLNEIMQNSVRGFKGADGVLRKADDFVSKLYQSEDAINRVNAYRILRENGWSKEEAKAGVESIMPDYTQPLPRGWQLARDTGISPFIAWNYYTVPKILKLMKTKEGAFRTAQVLGALGFFSYVMSGMSPTEQLPFADTDMPEWMKGKYLPIGRQGDEVTTLKVDRFIPQLQMMQPLNYIRDLGSGVPQNLFVSLAMQKKLYNGRPITYAKKSTGDKAYDYAKHYITNFVPLPQEAYNVWDLIDANARSKRRRKSDSVTEARTIPQSVAKLLGINTITYNKRALKNEQRRQK